MSLVFQSLFLTSFLFAMVEIVKPRHPDAIMSRICCNGCRQNSGGQRFRRPRILTSKDVPSHPEPASHRIRHEVRRPVGRAPFAGLEGLLDSRSGPVAALAAATFV